MARMDVYFPFCIVVRSAGCGFMRDVGDDVVQGSERRVVRLEINTCQVNELI